MNDLPDITALTAPEPEATDEQKASALPDPVGYRILCAVPQVEEKFESGLIKAHKTMETEHLLSTVLFVMKMGPSCYKDPKRFPDGEPWCKEGDFVLCRPHSGTRLMIFDKEFRIINDDSVEAVVDDPRGIRRA